MKRKLLAIAAVIAVIAVVLACFCANPVLSCPFDLPPAYEAEIRNQAKGLYSSRLPLVPVYVKVNAFNGVDARYTIYYFPFGTVEMSFINGEGWMVEKPLTGL